MNPKKYFASVVVGMTLIYSVGQFLLGAGQDQVPANASPEERDTILRNALRDAVADEGTSQSPTANSNIETGATGGSSAVQTTGATPSTNGSSPSQVRRPTTARGATALQSVNRRSTQPQEPSERATDRVPTTETSSAVAEIEGEFPSTVLPRTVPTAAPTQPAPVSAPVARPVAQTLPPSAVNQVAQEDQSPPTLPAAFGQLTPDSTANGQLPNTPGIGDPPSGNSSTNIFSPFNPSMLPLVAEDVPYEFNFPESPLDPIFEMYEELTGKMVIRSSALQGTVTLVNNSVKLTRAEAVEAISASLSLSDVILIPLGEKFVKAVPSAEANQHAPQIFSGEADLIPDLEKFITRAVKLEAATPSDVVQILTPLTKNAAGLIAIDDTQTLIINDQASNIRQMLEIIEQVDVTPEIDYSLEVIPIKYGRVTDLYNTMSSLISGGGGAVSSGTQSTTGFGGSNFGGGFGGGGFGGGFGTSSRGGFGGYGSTSRGGCGGSRGGYGGYGGSNYGYGGSGYRPFQASRSNVSTGQSNFNDRLRQIVNRAAGDEEEIQILSDARIVPDERSNQLLIFANKQDLTMITNMVNKVDVLLAQVLIEAVVLEVGLGDDQTIGVSWIQNPETSGQFSYGGAILNNNNALDAGRDFLTSGTISTNIPSLLSGFTYFGRYSDTLEVAVRAIATDRTVRVVQRPRIQTSHAVPGFFFLGETVPYVSGINDFGGFTGGISRSIVNQLQIGINLEVIPYITPEGYVVMDIRQNVDQRGEDVLIDGNPIPVVKQRQASASLSVRDGDTILLGGFVRQTKNESKSGVPYLKDIPGLGWLFRTKTQADERTELVILFKASVLETPEEAAMVAQQERDSMDEVRQMEEEFLRGRKDWRQIRAEKAEERAAERD